VLGLSSEVKKALALGRGYENLGFQLLRVIYLFTASVMALFAGTFVTRFGSSLCMIVFVAILALGQALVATGVWRKNAPLIFIGRLVMGMGGEPAVVTVWSLISLSFSDGQEQQGSIFGVGFALGSIRALRRLGSILSTVGSHAALRAGWELRHVFLISTGVNILAGLTVITLLMKLPRPESNESSSICEMLHKVRLNIMELSGQDYWLVVGAAMTFSCCYDCFNNTTSDQLRERFKLEISDPATGWLVTTPQTVSAVASPIVGSLCDKFASTRCNVLTGAGIGFMIAHGVLIYQGQRLWGMIICLVIIGVAMSTFASVVWPIVPIILTMELSPTGYGVLNCLCNVSMAVVSFAIGSLMDKTEGDYRFRWVQILLTTLAGIGLALALTLKFGFGKTCHDVSSITTSPSSTVDLETKPEATGQA